MQFMSVYTIKGGSHEKNALVSFMVVAVLGMMTSRAQGDDPPPDNKWSVSITIANSAETPVMLSLANNDDAGATFPGGGSTYSPGNPLS